MQRIDYMQKDGKAENKTQPHCLAVDIDEQSAACSGRFVTDFQCTDVLKSLNIPAIIIIIY